MNSYCVWFVHKSLWCCKPIDKLALTLFLSIKLYSIKTKSFRQDILGNQNHCYCIVEFGHVSNEEQWHTRNECRSPTTYSHNGSGFYFYCFYYTVGCWFADGVLSGRLIPFIFFALKWNVQMIEIHRLNSVGN